MRGESGSGSGSGISHRTMVMTRLVEGGIITRLHALNVKPCLPRPRCLSGDGCIPPRTKGG